jgi:PAS domain S-box-containing protein
MLAQSRDVVGMVGADGTIVYVSPSVEHVLGIPPEEVGGRSADDLIHPDDLAESRRRLERRLAGETAPALIRLRATDGEYRSIETVTTPVTDGDGRPTGIVFVARHVGERLQRQEALAALEAALDATHDAVVTTDADGTITGWNRGAEQIFGYSREEAVGMAGTRLFTPEEQLAEADENLQRIRRGEAIVGLEVTRRTKDGRLIDLEATASPLRDGDGTVVGSLSVVRDVTARKRAERALQELTTELDARVARRTRELQEVNDELRRARAEAVAANETNSAFLAHTSHQLRTPLNAILGFGELLQMDPDEDPRRAEAIDRIVSAGKHLLDVINELLDLAQIESGAVSLHLEEVMLDDVGAETIRLLEPTASDHSVTLRLRPGAPAVRADRQRLLEILLNLVDNGVRYNEPGGVVEIGWTAPAGGPVSVAVHDTGMGISPEGLERLFTPFERLAQRTHGTGLGLVVCKRLAEAMGGALRAESSLGAGSTFSIDLPAAQA